MPKLAGSVVEACVLVSTLPLGVGGASVRVARAGLVFALVPVFLACDRGRAGGALIEEVFRSALAGVALGLSATIVFGAVVAAASVIDAALMWTPLPDHAGSGSPIGLLYQLGFCYVLFWSGGFNAIVAAAAHASGQLPSSLMTLASVSVLGKICFIHGLALAAPALFAQAFASLLAGVAARAAPHVSGMLTSAPLIWSGVALVLVAGSSVLSAAFAQTIKDLIAFYNR